MGLHQKGMETQVWQVKLVSREYVLSMHRLWFYCDVCDEYRSDLSSLACVSDWDAVNQNEMAKPCDIHWISDI